jgi:DNA-binding transcriptional ArsR family regulator
MRPRFRLPKFLYLLPLTYLCARFQRSRGAVDRSQHVIEGEENLADVEKRPGGRRFVPMRTWAFITAHTRVLLAIARAPELRVDEIAEAAHVSERSAYRILSDLVEAGYLRRTRDGRRTVYELDRDLALGDPPVEEQPTSELLSLVGE